MKKIAIIFGVLLAVIAPVSFMYLYQQQHIDDLEARNETLMDEVATFRRNLDSVKEKETTQRGAYTSEKGVNIIVTTPSSDSSVVSPLEVKGSIPGSWSYEGEFLVKLLDSGGATLDEEPARIQGDWMTEEMRQFSATLIYSKPAGMVGSLVLEKANPSDLAENTDSLSIPIKF